MKKIKNKEITKENKSKNNNTNTELTAKRRTYDEHYLDLFFMKQMPVSEAFIERMSLELVKWSKDNDDALRLDDFLLGKGLSKSDYYRWKTKYNKLEEAHDFALRAIGSRREKGALKKQFDAGIVSYTMAHYDDDYKKLAEWKEGIKVTKNDSTGNVHVTIEAFPSTGKVPKKEKSLDLAQIKTEADYGDESGDEN